MSETIHLMAGGDTFFGATAWACGKKPADGDQGVLQASRVTCGGCKKTKLYKERVAEEEKEQNYPLIHVNAGTERHDWYEELKGAVVVGVASESHNCGPEKVKALRLEKDKRFYWVRVET